MSNYIREIIDFIWNLLLNIRNAISSLVSSNDAYFFHLSASLDNFNAFLDKNIINGNLLNISLTYRELILYLVPITLVFLSIYLIIKLIYKLLGLFRI